jgi:hypothetical protein
MSTLHRAFDLLKSGLSYLGKDVHMLPSAFFSVGIDVKDFSMGSYQLNQLNNGG